MFIGEYIHTLDSKKRLAVPSRFRSDLGKKAVITRGLDNCLFIYPINEWKKLAEKLGNLPVGQSNARGFMRLMLAGAMEVELDSAGRILVPDYLKKYAFLKKQAIVTGVYNRLEVWDKSRWDVYKQKSESTIGDMAEELSDLGI
jgi:MraZ protein